MSSPYATKHSGSSVTAAATGCLPRSALANRPADVPIVAITTTAASATANAAMRSSAT